MSAYKAKLKRWLIAVALLLGLGIAVAALAADTGFKDPSANAILSGGWPNPTNVYASDDVYSTVIVNNRSHVFYNYTAGGTSLYNAIPTGATIDGVEVDVETQMMCDLCINGDRVELTINISKDGGAGYGTGQLLNVTSIGADETLVFGGATSKFGLTLDKESFSDANFRVSGLVTSLTGGNETVSFDHLNVKVYYTVASTRRIIFIQ